MTLNPPNSFLIIGSFFFPTNSSNCIKNSFVTSELGNAIIRSHIFRVTNNSPLIIVHHTKTYVLETF